MEKRRKKPNKASDQTMEQILWSQGKQFYPIGFETYGTSTPQLTALLKKLSEVAAQRRDCNKMSFIRRWTVEIAMTLARRGCEAAGRRASEIRRGMLTEQSSYRQMGQESTDIFEDTDVILLQEE